jgi:predicted permease
MLLYELRHAARQTWRNIGLTATVAGTLALGIGVNTALFTILNAVLLNPVPVANLDRLVSIFTTDRSSSVHFPISTYNFHDLRDQSDVFTGMAAIVGFGQFTFAIPGDQAEQVNAQPVSANYFDVLGIRATIGRTFRDTEDAPLGAHPIAVISDALWTRRFGRKSSTVGATILLNGQPFTVVGVTPRAFRGTFTMTGVDLWIPLSMYNVVQPGTALLESRRWRWLTVIARLKPGASVQQAQAAVQTIAARLERDYPDVNSGRSAVVLPLAASLINPDQRASVVKGGVIVSAVVALILLIGCINLTSLLLARASARQKETAIRLAVGATRHHLVRQAIADTLLLSIIGGTVGLVLAWLCTAVFWKLRPSFLNQPGFELTIDGHTLAFTAVLTTLTGLIVGIVPVAGAAHSDTFDALRHAGRSTRGGVRSHVRNALVVLEVSLSAIALVVAVLFLRSLIAAQRIQPLFDAEHLLAVTVNLVGTGYDEARGQEWMTRVLSRVPTIPGVVHASLTDRLPLTIGVSYTTQVEGQPVPTGAVGHTVSAAAVAPKYFQALGVPLVSGRDFDDTVDRPFAPRVAIVNQTMARQFWPDQDPLGKRFETLVQPGWITVIGVARDSRYVTLGEMPRPFFYLPLRQQYRGSLSLVVNSSVEPAILQTAVRSELTRLDPGLAIVNISPISVLLSQSLWAPRMAAGLCAVLGLIAVLLVVIGIYGLLSYLVSQRSPELALRLAVGARPIDIGWLMLSGVLSVVAVGSLTGLVIGYGIVRSLRGLLYGVDPTDIITYIGVGTLLLLVALAASLLPVARALRVNPVSLLRDL